MSGDVHPLIAIRFCFFPSSDEIPNSAYGQCQPCSQSQYDFTPGDQYESAENYTTCEAPIRYPSDCNQFFAPPSSPSQHDQPSGDFGMPCQDQGYDASCYQPEFTTYINRSTPSQCQQPCEPRMLRMPCEPCPEIRYEPCTQSRCDPCQPFGPQQMPGDVGCPPRIPCPPPCSPMCSPYKRLRYVQPPRRESCKPIVRYQRPCIPMTSDTVYKTSFDFINAETAKSCRMPPVMPAGQLRLPCGEFAKETVTNVNIYKIKSCFNRFNHGNHFQLSFQPICRPERTRPIYPNSPSLLGCGPMQGLTTQKHDFVPKFQYKRVKCAPRDNITRNCGCVERCTVQRLSFMPPDMCNYSRAESCKPIICYKPPECKFASNSIPRSNLCNCFLFISADGIRDDAEVELHARLSRPEG